MMMKKEARHESGKKRALKPEANSHEVKMKGLWWYLGAKHLAWLRLQPRLQTPGWHSSVERTISYMQCRHVGMHVAVR